MKIWRTPLSGAQPHAIAFSRPARGHGTEWETGCESGYGTATACGDPLYVK